MKGVGRIGRFCKRKATKGLTSCIINAALVFNVGTLLFPRTIWDDGVICPVFYETPEAMIHKGKGETRSASD